MKFHQVALQQKFFYRNKLYIKTGPLTANEIESQGNILVARHADVSPAVEELNAETIAEPVLLDAQQVQQALQVFHNSIIATVTELKKQPNNRLTELESIIETQWNRLLDGLNLQG